MANDYISRREFLERSIYTGTALSVAVSARAMVKETSKPARKPNILLIFSDQQYWEAMGCMDPLFDTPNLDMLAKESMVFE